MHNLQGIVKKQKTAQQSVREKKKQFQETDRLFKQALCGTGEAAKLQMYFIISLTNKLQF
jgi:Holliday junction resolvasome RuvABC endonuclease subunit